MGIVSLPLARIILRSACALAVMVCRDLARQHREADIFARPFRSDAFLLNSAHGLRARISPGNILGP